MSSIIIILLHTYIYIIILYIFFTNTTHVVCYVSVLRPVWKRWCPQVTGVLVAHLHRGQAQETMGCGASVNNVKANGASSPVEKIKVKRARRFDVQDGLGDEFSMHAKLSMYMLFAKYDVDASGEIDANELYKMKSYLAYD